MATEAYAFHLFDLDGTLVDADPAYVRDVFDGVADRLGREFSETEARVLWHGLGGSRNATLNAWGIDPDAFWEAFHAEEDPQVRAEATFLHDDAERLLTDLEGPVGLVTHCQQFLADPVLDRLDLRDHFDAVVCCTDRTGWKPDPDPIELALSRMGIDPGNRSGRGYYAGDGESDVGAAWNAGLDAVHVERLGHGTRGRCVLGDYRVGSFDEFRAADPVGALGTPTDPNGVPDPGSVPDTDD